MSELLGVAVLGAGHMGADHIRRVDQVVSCARVAAVADPDAERAKEAVGGIGAGYGSYDGGYGGEQYQAAQQYDPGAYGQQPYP
ncbi:Gfo/Idh/MocA family oxidoreductase, partial [Streptomyces violaceoruber]